MALIKKEETLVFTFKIPRSLHDKVDEVREAAKQLKASFDPTAKLIKALEKDLAATLREIEAAQKEAKESKVQ